jgi:photosystem II stability/assembly factor-like uncharacterized protein
MLVRSSLPASAQDWTPINSGTSATLRAIEQGSSAVRYLVGEAGYVSLSNPALTDWTPQDAGTTADVISIVAAGGLKWISGVGGVVRVRDNTGTWNIRNIPDQTQDFVLISRGNGEVLAAGSGGSIWKTINGGLTWSLQNSGTTSGLRAGFSETSGDGYVVGEGGLILKSVDGGATWATLASGTTDDLYAIHQGAVVPGGARIVAAGAKGTLLTSDDDGETWTQRESGTTNTLRALARSGQSAAGHLAVGDDGTVRRSTDNGETWCSLTTGVTTDIHAAVYATGSIHLVAGEGGTLLYTENGGGSCPSVGSEAGITFTIEDARLTTTGGDTFYEFDVMVAAGGDGTRIGPALVLLDYNADGFGASVAANGAITVTEGDLISANDNYGLVVNDNTDSRVAITATYDVFDPDNGVPLPATPQVLVHVALKVSDPAETSQVSLSEALMQAQQFEDDLATPFVPVTASDGDDMPLPVDEATFADGTVGALSAAYPNPFNTQTTFSLAVATTQHVEIEAFDVLGRRVAVLFSGNMPSHESTKFVWNAERLPSGLYFVRVLGEHFETTHRVSLVR